MIKINTYIEDLNNLSFPTTDKLVRVDNTLKMKEMSSKISSIFNRYCIEIILNNEILKPLKILTTEPWVTYLCLMKNYLHAGYAEVHDLTQPIIYYFIKDKCNGAITFKVKNQTYENCEDTFTFPEEEFLECIYQGIVHYLDYMKDYNPTYFSYWVKRFGNDLYFVANEIEARYLVSN